MFNVKDREWFCDKVKADLRLPAEGKGASGGRSSDRAGRLPRAAISGRSSPDHPKASVDSFLPLRRQDILKPAVASAIDLAQRKSAMNRAVWISVAGWLCVVQAAFAAEFYIDPQLGDASNDGSPEKPWKSLQDVVDRGWIESQQWSQLPYGPSSRLVPRNAGAPVRAGDTIYLRTGYHGALDIQGHYNRGHITIAAQEGHTPKFRRIRIRSASCWTLRGLHISPEFAGEHETGTLIDLDSHGFRGPVSEIIVEDCTAFSVRDAATWTAKDWNNRACNAIDVDGRRMTVRNCKFRNVNFGISVSATHSLISGNTCLLYTSPSPRDRQKSRMPSSA
jgi:hypothetical protein